MSEEEDRAERAFRAAFGRRAGDLEPVDLHGSWAAERRPWLLAAVVAAVLVVVGGTSVLAMTSGGDRSGPPPAANGRTTASTSGADPAAPEQAGTLPTPDSGWRWVSWRNVAVQVPADWGYGLEPMQPWCMYDSTADVARAPYVAQDSTGMGIDGVGCLGTAPDHHPEVFGPAPALFWAPHVSFEEATSRSSGDEIASFRDWILTSRRVGDVQVSLLVNAETSALSGRILDSARTFETDQNGCEASSPVQAGEFVRPHPFDVASLRSVDSISVCQYARGVAPDRPALMGSRLLAGPQAAAVLAAIQSAPVGGGPDTPQTCTADLYGDTGIALHLHRGDLTRDVYVYYDWCFGNGFDDGTSRRELTREACVPLFGDNVAQFSGSSAPFRRCHL